MLRSPDDSSVARVRKVSVDISGMFRLSKLPDTEPFFASQARYRFDDPAGASSKASFGVLYVGQDPETAFCESIIHGNSSWSEMRAAYEVSHADLRARSLVVFRHPTKSALVLADLTGDGLKAIGLNNDISAGSAYGIPQQWAAAIHKAHPDVDGIRYVSRQNNDGHCYAVFNRSGLMRDSHIALPDDVLNSLCQKFNVVQV